MLEEKMVLRNYAHLGDTVGELFVRNYTVLKTSNAKILHKITTERVNAIFQKEMGKQPERELLSPASYYRYIGRRAEFPDTYMLSFGNRKVGYGV